MLSKKERRYLELPRLFNKDYSYVVKHRIRNKILELQKDLDLIVDSKENFYKSWLSGIFKNFIARVPDDNQEKYVPFKRYHKLKFDYNQLLKNYESYCLEEK